MKAIYFIILLSINLLATQTEQALLESISKHAIRIGVGNISTKYVFVDPMCQHSKNYIKKISSNKSLKDATSYYIFLYRLPKFKSDRLIEYIYQSKDKGSSLKDIMIDDKDIDFDFDFDDFTANKETLHIIHEISKVAQELKVKHRPHIIRFFNPVD